MGDRTCSLDGCESRHWAKGLCASHYTQQWKRDNPDGTGRVCEVDGCGRKHEAKGLCKYHYCRERYGDSHRRRVVVCHQCGIEFESLRGVDQERYFCSHDCYGKFRTKPPEHHRELRRRHSSMRRALERGARIETFDHREIFERDGWRCGICRKLVGRSYSYPHPRSASLDHIVPLAAGGSHARDNVQCSHLACNLKKQAIGPGQLLLIG